MSPSTTMSTNASRSAAGKSDLTSTTGRSLVNYSLVQATCKSKNCGYKWMDYADKPECPMCGGQGEYQ